MNIATKVEITRVLSNSDNYEYWLTLSDKSGQTIGIKLNSTLYKLIEFKDLLMSVISLNK